MRELSFTDQIRPYLKRIKMQIGKFARAPLKPVCFFLLLSSLIIALSTGLIFRKTNPHELHYSNPGILLTYQNRNWRQYIFEYNETLYDLSQLPTGELAIIGSKGFYLLSDGDKWLTPQSFGKHDLYSIDCQGDLCLIVGEKGLILKYIDGAWELMSSPSDKDIFMVKIQDNQYALAVGADGLVMEYDGASWLVLDPPTNKNINALAFTGPKEAVAVGDDGTLLHIGAGGIKKGKTDLVDNSSYSFYGVAVCPAQKIIAVGERGTILVYSDGLWQRTTSPEYCTLNTVILTSDGQGFIGGDDGILLAYRNKLWQRINLDYNGPFNAFTSTGNNIVLLGGKPYLKKLNPPSEGHPLGTDIDGQDVYRQMLYGTKASILSATLISFFLTIITIALTLLINNKISPNVLALLHSFPTLLLAIIIASNTESFLLSIALALIPAIILLGIPKLQKHLEDYKNSASYNMLTAIGGNRIYIVFPLVMEHFARPLTNLFLRTFTWALTLETSLSFLGFTQPFFFSWGTMLNRAYWSDNWFGAWWWIIPPGLALTIITTAAQILIKDKGDYHGPLY